MPLRQERQRAQRRARREQQTVRRENMAEAALPHRVVITTKLSDTPVLDSNLTSLPAWKWQFKNFATRLDLQDLFLTEAGTSAENPDQATQKKFADANSILTYAASKKITFDHAYPRRKWTSEHQRDVPSPRGVIARQYLGSPLNDRSEDHKIQTGNKIHRRLLR